MTNEALLVLSDGTVFRGRGGGKPGKASGEVVFNTAMTGYQEILTDPSYANQMIAFTHPYVGNVGVNRQDVESTRVHATGLIVRELSQHFSNYRAEKSLDEYLRENGVPAIWGIDTRKLVIHLREHGAQMGILAVGDFSEEDLLAEAKALPPMEGQDLVRRVTTSRAYDWTEGSWQPEDGAFCTYTDSELEGRPLALVVDCGVKFNILRLLVDQGFRVKVVPATTSSEALLSFDPDGIFLSNGPGDPAVLGYLIEAVRGVLGKKPIFGICLGHQVLGLALGVSTFKLKFGHHGANHPVKDERRRKVEITAQNHGFATRATDLPPGVILSHLNLNDRTVSGFDVPEKRAFSVQYHPEASPGPQDSRYLFRKFFDLADRERVGRPVARIEVNQQG